MRAIRALAINQTPPSPDVACSDTTVLLIFGAVVLAAAAGVLLGFLHLRNRED
jgi:ABC-type branched-subunit amino acid transport system permease subunit